MPIDFENLNAPLSEERPIEPVSLFRTLKVSDPAIKDLWLGQGDALRDWHSHRNASDVAIVLNTGAGKTLVGLLAAQSLVNETRGKVVYACSSIQLVRQSERKAAGYGLFTTTYLGGAFNNTFFQEGRAPCLTTYHALFNGLSRFFRAELAAVIFDDSHTVGHLLRDQFTLKIRRSIFPNAFDQLFHLYRPYFVAIRQDMGYIEAYDNRDGSASRLVPPFTIQSNYSELQNILRHADLDRETDTKFPWAHLRDHLDQCAVFVSGDAFAFTPPVVPVQSLPYFADNVRRLYLSATLGAPDAFLRTFGKVPDQVITPSTPAGECERLILIPNQIPNKTDWPGDVQVAQTAIAGEKSLVLVPSKKRAELWKDIATAFDGDADEQLEQFKTVEAPACLVLAARYDGVDLPGDSCRVLVVDDVPTGMNPLERFQWERLNLQKILRSTVASRVIQSFGRISRGMSDHGVVLLTGTKLLEWLLIPVNMAMMPEFLQRQIALGLQMSRDADSLDDFGPAIKSCLIRDPRWVSYYDRTMQEVEIDRRTFEEDAAEALRISRAESLFGHLFWERDYTGAAKVLEASLDATFASSRPTGAWHALWLGACFELTGNVKRANDLYVQAHKGAKEIPPLPDQLQSDSDGLSIQVIAVANSLRSGSESLLIMPRRFDIELAALDGNGTPKQTERALELLGAFLGLESSRPETECGTGPDVLWIAPNGALLSMEAKTDKGPESVYGKGDLGQLRDHLQWVLANHEGARVHSIFIGPVVPASTEANPGAEMIVIELSEFRQLRDRLGAALLDIIAAGTAVTALRSCAELLENRGLLWPEAFSRLRKHPLARIT